MTTHPTDTSLVLQQPAAPRQLFLLFHGVGADADDLAPLGERLARTFPEACVVSVPAPELCDFASGRQWFSVRGVDEANRIERVAAAMPAFESVVRDWQQRTGVAPEATALVGFSQGGIMALESTRDRPGPALAGRVVGISARFAALPETPSADTTLHLLHGKQDAVIAYGYAVEAAEHLVALKADVTADVLPFVGHEITPEVVDLLIERLTTYIPRRLWAQAMAVAEAQAGDED